MSVFNVVTITVRSIKHGKGLHSNQPEVATDTNLGVLKGCVTEFLPLRLLSVAASEPNLVFPQ